MKRTLDLSIATLALIFFFPFLLLVALAIKIDSEGPFFVEQSDRVGKDGKIFRMYKFRTMVKRADKKIQTYLTRKKKNNFKPEKDLRITRVGRLLRRFSIDEFPQLVNIIKGEMSLVGPRAMFVEELEVQSKLHPNLIPLLDQIIKVKPGASGVWQVSGRANLLFQERVKIDADYSANPSPWIDLVVMAKTPFAILGGKGAR